MSITPKDIYDTWPGDLVWFPFGQEYKLGIVLTEPKRIYMVGKIVDVLVDGNVKRIKPENLFDIDRN